jgi:16S rRNA processing protein RimM
MGHGKSQEDSAETGADQFLAIARVIRPQGRRGEVVAEILTDFPERFENLTSAFRENHGGPPRAVTVENCWPHKGRMVLKFSGVDSIDEAERLRGLHLFIRREERLALPENHYYVSDLEGCRVIRKLDGVEHEVGIVTEVERAGGADLLHVAPAGDRAKEVLVPLAQDICKRIDTAAKVIVIEPPENLLEVNK